MIAELRSTGPVALRAHGLTKAFAGVTVLDNVDLEVQAGEIHGLLGQNGSGKSTLVRILTGFYAADGGDLLVHGEHVPLPVTRPLRHGISVIHQDIGLVDELSVFDNVSATVGYGVRSFLPVPTKREQDRVASLAQGLGVKIDFSRLVGDLTAAERTFVGVLRALRAMDGIPPDQRILILDEPTTSLPAPDALQVTDLMRQLAAAGSAVVFISHRIGEVMKVCDSATVLRSGKLVYRGSLIGMGADQLTEQILGRRMEAFYPTPPAHSGKPAILRVRGLSGKRLQEVSFDLHAGEILGVTGLMGMGQEELPLLLSGGSKPTAGDVRLANDRPLAKNVHGAIAQRVALVPGNRARDGAWLAATARENMTLPVLGRYRGRAGLDWRRETRDVHEWMIRVGAVPPTPEKPLQNFSGGNQQKLILAKWLQTEPSVLILDEPTQGIDAGAKHDLLEILLSLTNLGTGLILVSGDHDQLAHVCSRVLVIHEGLMIREASGDDLTEERLMHFCNDFDGASRAQGGVPEPI